MSWWLRNTWGFNWLWQIIDARNAAHWHPDEPSIFWRRLKQNFKYRWRK